MALSNLGVEEGDPIFPGEGWFLYWKTSSSLWKAKLTEYSGTGPIFVPINWAFHSDNGETYEFNPERPETDLKRLAEIADGLCKKLIFLFPLTSFPFLPNGGLPASLARTLSMDQNKLSYGLVDPEGNIHKIYSFFDPRVYQSYRKLVWEFSQYIGKSNLTFDIIGLVCGYAHDRKYFTYLEDYSKVFDQGFSRFLEMKKKEGGENVDFMEMNAGEREDWWKLEFAHMIRELYLTSAREGLGPNWGGELKVAFLGGSPYDIFERSSESNEFSGRYFNPLMDILSLNVVPSSILLPYQVKRGTLNRFLRDLVNNRYFYSQLDMELYDDEYGMNYIPLKFFEIYQNPVSTLKKFNTWEKLGVYDYLNHEYRGTYCLPTSLSFLKSQDYTSDRIFMVLGQDLQMEEFKCLIKVFLNGGKVILDRTGLREELKRKLEGFILENSIAVQKINYISEIMNATLGEGIFIIFDGKKIQEVPLMKKMSFWDNIVGLIKVDHLKIQDDSGLFYYWRHRSPKPNEIYFTGIRRVSFFNPTSYRKRAKIPNLPNFEFIKILDQTNTEVQMSTLGVDIELFPEGSISVDYGHNE